MTRPFSGPPPIAIGSIGDTEGKDRAPSGRAEQAAGASATVVRAKLTEAIGPFPAGTQVACKRPVHPGSPASHASMKQELDLLGEVQDPALLKVIAHGTDEVGPWWLLPFLDGPTLAQRLEDGNLPEDQLRSIGIRLAGALSALHQASWVHGDVKPDNIMFDGEGHAFLLDLGFAARAGEPFGERGTPGYLAPEYGRGGKWSGAGDLFALGVTMYTAAVGEHPVPAALERGSHEAILLHFSREDARRPSRRFAALSPAFDQWLAQMLDPAADSRGSAAASAARLGAPPPWSMVETDTPTDQNPWSSALRIPLVGRENELHKVAHHWGTVLAENKPCLLLVRSDPGGGRTRLMAEAARRARMEKRFPTLLTGRLTAYDEERPGHVLRGLVRQWLGLSPHAAPRAQDRESLNKLLPPTEATALIDSLGPEDPESPGLTESRALVSFFVRLAERGPLWILLDDAQYGGRASLEPLERLALQAGETPLLVTLGLATTKQERSGRALSALISTWATRGPAVNLHLAPLTQAGMLAFVRAHFAPSAESREIATALFQSTEGRPGQLRELLRHLESLLHITEGPAGWRLQIAPAQIPVPPSFVQSTSRRYSELSKDARGWLVRCALAGAHIDPSLLARAFSESEEEVEYQIGVFVRSGWLERSSGGARFRRPQVRQALVRAIPAARKARLHNTFAEALEPRPGDPFPAGLAFEQAWHLRQAGANEKLQARLPRLLRITQHSGHPSRMLRLAKWGLEAHRSEPNPKDREPFAYLILATQAAHELGRRSEEQKWIGRLVQLDLDPHKDARRLGLVQLKVGRYHEATSSAEKALEYLQSARRCFQRSGAKELEAEATLDYGFLCAATGDRKEAGWAADAAAELELTSPERARVHILKGTLALLDDDLEASLRSANLAKRILTLDPRRRARSRAASAELLRSRCYRLLGRPRRAWASLSSADRLAAFAGERTLEVEVLVRRGRLLTEFGREVAAERDLRDALRLAESIDHRRARTRGTLLLGILLAERELGEGQKLLYRALKLSQEYKYPRLEGLASTLCARLSLRIGEWSRAHALSERALYLFHQVGTELQDRVVALCTAHLVQTSSDKPPTDRNLRQAQRAWQSSNERLSTPILKRRHRMAYQALMRAAISLDGPLYPRNPTDNLPDWNRPNPNQA